MKLIIGLKAFSRSEKFFPDRKAKCKAKKIEANK